MSESSEGKKSESRAGSIMDDSRRFLRYVMPGLVFGVQVGGLLYIVYPDLVWKTIAEFSGSEKNALAAVIASFLVSGALGYIFAAIHHEWLRGEMAVYVRTTAAWLCRWNIEKRWLKWLKWLGNCLAGLLEPSSVLDHTGWVKKHYARGEGEPPLERPEAEALVWKDYYQQIEPNGIISKAVQGRIESLADQAHGFGAARIASVFALVTFWWRCAEFSWRDEPTSLPRFWTLPRFWIATIVGVMICWSLWHAFNRLGTAAQRVFERVMEDDGVVKSDRRAD
jgi:hypothetical protein